MQLPQDHQNQDHNPWSLPDKSYASCKNLKSQLNHKQFEDNFDVEVNQLKKTINNDLIINFCYANTNSDKKLAEIEKA